MQLAVPAARKPPLRGHREHDGPGGGESPEPTAAPADVPSPRVLGLAASRARPRQLRIASVSTAVSPHTQWCDHEMGEISRPANALRDSAQASADAASALRMPRQASATTTADRASHVTAPAGECGSSPARASTP